MNFNVSYSYLEIPNTKMNIKNIIFDLGNVLLLIDTSLSKIAFEKKGLKNFHKLYSLAEQNQLFDLLETGKISENVFYEKFRDITKSTLSNEEIRDCWNKLIVKYPTKNIKIALIAKNKYKTFILSNTNIIHYKYYTQMLKKKFNIEGLESIVHKAYFSHEIGLRKPNPNFFNLLLNENKINPSESLFIDDDIRNIQTAEFLGIKTFHLTDLKLNKAFKTF